MLVHRDAAAIVAHRQPVALGQRYLDAVGVPGHRLVHRIVDYLGGEMVQRPLVDPADIHSRPSTHGFQPLQHLDCGGIVIAAIALGQRVEQIVGHRPTKRKLRAKGKRAGTLIASVCRPMLSVERPEMGHHTLFIN